MYKKISLLCALFLSSSALMCKNLDLETIFDEEQREAVLLDVPSVLGTPGEFLQYSPELVRFNLEATVRGGTRELIDVFKTRLLPSLCCIGFSADDSSKFEEVIQRNQNGTVEYIDDNGTMVRADIIITEIQDGKKKIEINAMTSCLPEDDHV
jgi:hypothetical protein